MPIFGEVAPFDRLTAAQDAFGRIRTSNPHTLFHVQNQYNATPLKMEAFASGTGVAPTHNANTRMVKLSCTSGVGVSAFQSYQYIHYQPGKSQLIEVTGVFDTPVANGIVDVGAFDANNGIFLRQNGTTNYQIILRTSTSGSVVETGANNLAAQSAWNIDTMLNGTGPSGVTLNLQKAFILVIDAQFLGMGRVRVGFSIDGAIYWVHEFKNANNLTVPYMQTLDLPIQALVTSTGAGSTANFYFKCAAVHSEGGWEDSGSRLTTPEQTVTAANGSRTHLLSLRPKTTFNSLTNRTTVFLRDLNMIVTGNSPVFWELCLGTAFSAGPTYADVNTTFSSCEYSSAVGTYSNLTNGFVIQSGYITSSAQAKGEMNHELGIEYPITLDRAGAVRALGTVSLLVTGIGGSSACRASFCFDELR